MGLRLREMKGVMYTHKPSLQITLVGTLVSTLKNLVGSHIALVQLSYSCQVKVASAQEHLVSHSMLLVSVVAVIVVLLVLLGLLKVILSTLQQDLHVLHKVTSTSMAASLGNYI